VTDFAQKLRSTLAARRVFVGAVAVSALAHAVVLSGLRLPDGPEAGLVLPPITAHLEAAPAVEPAPAPPAPARKARTRPRPKAPAPALPPDTLALPVEAESLSPAAIAQAETEAPAPAAPLEPEPVPEPARPEVVALAKPASPLAQPEMPDFRPDALPQRLTIAYALVSSLVEGEAEYTWTRDGDRYEIAGNAQANGFFTLFLEGSITQESRGRVTPEGLRPERFVERRGDRGEEGLDFDWAARTVRFRRGDSERAAPLTDSTVDWLTMIFQLAHAPQAPREGQALRVFTQRRLYEYRLRMVGTEEIEVPIGRVRAVHLRHDGARPAESVDVWLGIDQHYLPVKLRYPVARNRLLVEQVATRLEAR
jgi:hypothetical protein